MAENANLKKQLSGTLERADSYGAELEEMKQKQEELASENSKLKEIALQLKKQVGEEEYSALERSVSEKCVYTTNKKAFSVGYEKSRPESS